MQHRLAWLGVLGVLLGATLGLHDKHIDLSAMRQTKPKEDSERCGYLPFSLTPSLGDPTWVLAPRWWPPPRVGQRLLVLRGSPQPLPWHTSSPYPWGQRVGSPPSFSCLFPYVKLSLSGLAKWGPEELRQFFLTKPSSFH